MRPAVFLDRDGTLIEEAGYFDRLERLSFFPYAIDAVRLLNRAAYAVVITTNQSGIARGLFDEEFVRETHDEITARLSAGGATIDGFYYCPHHPEATIERYRKACDCRKPAPGMLVGAAADLDIDLARSFTVGDRWSDVAVASAAGARGVLVRTGYGRTSEASAVAGVRPAAITDNVMSAVAWILRER